MYSYSHRFNKAGWRLVLLIALVVTSLNLQVPPGNAQDNDATAVPTVYATPQFETQVSTHTYAQGQTHTEWGGDSTGTVDLLLDVYEPVDAPGNRPAMLIIHGGAFQLGSRTQDIFVQTAEHFASRGWVAISIDYRLAGDFGTAPQEWLDDVTAHASPSVLNGVLAIYAASRDTKAAVRWLYANAETYQINTDYITAFGVSAGASLALMLGVTDEAVYRDELTLEDDPTLETTNPDQPAAVHTVVGLSLSDATITLLDVVYGLNPYDESDPPIMIVNGTEDNLVDFNEILAMVDQLEAADVPHAFYPIEGAGHILGDAQIDGMNLIDGTFAFVVEEQALTLEE